MMTKPATTRNKRQRLPLLGLTQECDSPPEFVSVIASAPSFLPCRVAIPSLPDRILPRPRTRPRLEYHRSQSINYPATEGSSEHMTLRTVLRSMRRARDARYPDRSSYEFAAGCFPGARTRELHGSSSTGHIENLTDMELRFVSVGHDRARSLDAEARHWICMPYCLALAVCIVSIFTDPDRSSTRSPEVCFSPEHWFRRLDLPPQ
jgi:hypothetical protein